MTEKKKNDYLKKTTYMNSGPERNDYWIYYVIMFLCVFIRWIPISSGSANVDDVINDIVIGGFSSTLVALLIARHDNKRVEREKQRLCNRITESFYSELFQYFALMEVLFFDDGLSCLNCFKALKEDNFVDENWAAELSQWAYLNLVEMQNRIAGKADEILEQEFDLINEKIISVADIDSIRKLRRCIISMSENAEEIFGGIYKFPKLVIRHQRIMAFLKEDDRFTNKLIEMYPKYFEKYQYGQDRDCSQVYINL